MIDIKSLLKKDYTNPNVKDENFMKKIYEKREYHYHKIPRQKKIKTYEELKKFRQEECTGIKNLNHQSLLSNLFTPDTPLTGCLFFHKPGSGKTCLAIKIAEKHLDMVIKYNTKIYVLTPGTLIKESWKDEILKCTKEKYLKDYNSNIGYIDDDEKERVRRQAKNLVSQYYRIISHRAFHKKVLGHKLIERTEVNGEIVKNVRKDEFGEFERDISIDKIENLDNTVLIIDEAHHFTDNEFGDALKKIIAKSKNLKVFLLTATPMKNLADDIIELINYIRPMNDQIKRELVFTQDRGSTMKFKPGGKEYLGNMVKGYVSYFNGSSSYLFAEQVDIGEVPEGLLFTPLIHCEMQEFQNKVYVEEVEKGGDTLDRKSNSIANFVFPNYNDSTKMIEGVFGIEGINSLRLSLKNPKQVNEEFKKYFELKTTNFITDDPKNKSVSGDIFKLENIKNFSIKFYECMCNINKLINENAGTAFIYSGLVKIGVQLFEKVLLANGFLEFREDGNYIILPDTVDYLTGVKFSEFDNKNIKNFAPATFISITGDSEDKEGEINIPEEKKRILDKVFSDVSNIKGRNIKCVLGSVVMSEGMTMKNLKEIHIIHTSYHLGLLVQVIGRGIRFCVHNDVASEEVPYPKVNVYRYVVKSPTLKGLSTEEILYKKAELKYLLVKETERLLKENSLDCPLLYNSNVDINNVEKYEDCISPLEYDALSENEKKKFKMCPMHCDFKSCLFECNDKELNFKYYNKDSKMYKKIEKSNLDFSTFTNKMARNEIDFSKEKIKLMFLTGYAYNLRDILEYVKMKITGENKDLFEDFFVYKALDELTPMTENEINNFQDTIYDKFSVPGYLIYRKKYYIFQPFNESENTPMYYRKNYVADLKNQLSFRQFLKNDEGINDDDEEILKNVVDYNFDLVKDYYSNKDDFEIVGIIDKPLANKKSSNEVFEDVFKIREKFNKSSKKRGTGIFTFKGSVCQTSKEIDYLIKIAKKIGVKVDKNDKRIDVCNSIRLRLLYLEKYSKGKDKKTYLIIPFNHPVYPFPLNLEDRIEDINVNIENRLTEEVKFIIKEDDNGIFEGVRNKKFTKYHVSFVNKDSMYIHKEAIEKMGFVLNGNKWSKTIE